MFKGGKPRGRPAKKKKVPKATKQVVAISAVNSTTPTVVPLGGQAKHKLRNMYKHGMVGGRGCTVCAALGSRFYSRYSKPNQKKPKQTGWGCLECKRYMCEECYFLYKKHVGFHQLHYG